jgi:type III restriction enzyme
VVRARWVFDREVRRRHKGALGVATTSDPKFDALIGLGSRAYVHMIETAEKVVNAYLEEVYLVQRKYDPYTVGSLLMKPDKIERFSHALHGGYDGLNPLEGTFARELNKVGLPWCRNPSRVGFGIPLVSLGPTQTFYPDFLVWSGSDVFAIDTKGGHLLMEAASRKLLNIGHADGVTSRLFVRFISEGQWNTNVELVGKGGYSAWSFRVSDGKRKVVHFDDLSDAVDAALAAPSHVA